MSLCLSSLNRKNVLWKISLFFSISDIAFLLGSGYNIQQLRENGEGDMVE